jgi:hypothetical protein
VRKPEVGYLSQGVNAGIGSTGANDCHGLAGEPKQSVLNNALHR